MSLWVCEVCSRKGGWDKKRNDLGGRKRKSTKETTRDGWSVMSREKVEPFYLVFVS